jgi:hypothetical protein
VFTFMERAGSDVHAGNGRGRRFLGKGENFAVTVCRSLPRMSLPFKKKKRKKNVFSLSYSTSLMLLLWEEAKLV